MAYDQESLKLHPESFDSSTNQAEPPLSSLLNYLWY